MAENYIFKLFEGLNRQGPGNDGCTKKAFSYLKNLPENPKILDIGCDVVPEKERINDAYDAGYSLVTSFRLPVSAWTDEYYAPVPKRVKAFRNEYKDNPDAQNLADAILEEISFYNGHFSEYGYTFYIFHKEE
ncbi:hypothetical protein J2128_001502 [Methanomicrobium sp. W14]|uniref:hypothetical protein n=1 Tax=Methanomicrobium sp. W14 TaxID=2817839 RepID=UPI001AE2AB96|nr:hypothetical protein [Methanomicrobium sp. W14]MBP2133548.1 hypothetical protein [Methanomicrobium sp. W14]